MATDFIRIPPDSTGKKIRHIERTDIVVTNTSPNLQLFERGDSVVGETSGVTATFIGTEVELGQEFIYVSNASGQFTVGETLNINSISSTAEVVSSQVVYTPTVQLADPDNTSNRQKVSNEGAAIVRFVEGNLGFDTFGHGQFAQPVTKDIHSFIYEDRGAEKYGDVEVNGGSIDINSDSSELVLSVSGVSGSLASRQTHQYYPYTPGVGSEVLISTKAGDSGKDNLVRRWGLFDDNDGLYFEQSGSVLSVNIRSLASGTITETKVEQGRWNGARLEGNIGASYPIDLTKYNLFWIDFAWLGINKIRFGVYTPEGDRLTVHTFDNANNLVLPYTRRATLPLRVEIENEDTVGSSSEFSMICSAIKTQSALDDYRGKIFEATSEPTPISSSEFTPIISFQPRVTFGGKDNRITYFANRIEFTVKGSPVEVLSFTNPTLSGSTFNATTSSYQSLTVDTDASGSTGGVERGGWLVDGTGFRDIPEDFENSIINLADGTAPVISFQGKTSFPGDTADIICKIGWKEVH